MVLTLLKDPALCKLLPADFTPCEQKHCLLLSSCLTIFSYKGAKVVANIRKIERGQEATPIIARKLLLSFSLFKLVNPLKRWQAELQQVNLVFSRQAGFSSRSIRFIIPEPAVSSALLVGQGLRLYPSNM